MNFSAHTVYVIVIKYNNWKQVLLLGFKFHTSEGFCREDFEKRLSFQPSILNAMDHLTFHLIFHILVSLCARKELWVTEYKYDVELTKLNSLSCHIFFLVNDSKWRVWRLSFLCLGRNLITKGIKRPIKTLNHL